MVKIDLHSHSYYSDGSLAPTEVVERAAARGVELLALTDHDAIMGVAEAASAAKSVTTPEGASITLMPGVEISANWQTKEIHILGLGVDPNNAELLEGLSNQQRLRRERAQKMGEQLDAYGIPGIYQHVTEIIATRAVSLSRAHFAFALTKLGHAKDMKAAFKKFLRPGCPGYVPCQWADYRNVIQWITAAGGKAVVAHPLRYRLTNGLLRNLLRDFKRAGGQGLEVVSSNATVKQIRQLQKLAVQNDLVGSMGSDFHTPDLPHAVLGRLAEFPENVTPVWQDWITTT